MWNDAVYTRLAYQESLSQRGLTAKGIAILNATPEPQEAPEEQADVELCDVQHITEEAEAPAGCLF